MSPVGSYESLMAAIQGGADSVYFGVEQLNMRSRSANNFTLSDLKTITDICKEYSVKSYLTLNTIIYDEELSQMMDIVDAAKTSGISAIIASDMSVLNYAHSINMPLHLSTQCNVSNSEAVRYYSQFADVIVLARELNLKQISGIVKFVQSNQIKGPSGNLIEIEVFVHGALCMAVSGKCYISLDNANASANRGSCLQFCRRQYKVSDFDDEVELKVDNSYIMSPKDLKTIDFLDKIIGAGVRVLKIEGRGRSPEYVKTVTACYKEAVESYYKGEFTEEAVAGWNERLKSVYNRGFWEGYYLGRKIGEWTERYGSQSTQTKIYVGKVTNYFSRLQVAEIKMETHDLKTGDSILILGPTTGVYEDVVNEIRVDLQTVQQTIKGETCSISTREVIRRNDKVYKLVSSNNLDE